VRDAWITEAMAVLQRDFLPEHLVTELTANAMDASVAVQADQSETETMLLVDFAEKNERIAGVVGWVDLRSSNLADRLEYFSHFSKLRGFRHIAQAEPDDRFLMRERLRKGRRPVAYVRIHLRHSRVSQAIAGRNRTRDSVSGTALCDRSLRQAGDQSREDGTLGHVHEKNRTTPECLL